MQNLLIELMEFRKAESGHIPLQPEKIEVQPLIDFISDNYSELAAQNRIVFTIETENLSTFVTDRNAFEKIVLNLISNAFKYTPSNGYILFRMDQHDDGMLRFRVNNSGRGLTERQQRDVFDRFSIFGSDKSAGTISMGIGLNLTKGLVELMHGKITVTSQPDDYVEFSVSLPPMAPQTETSNETKPTKMPNRSITEPRAIRRDVSPTANSAFGRVRACEGV